MLKTISRKIVIIGWLVFGLVSFAVHLHLLFLVVYAINTAVLLYLMKAID